MQTNMIGAKVYLKNKDGGDYWGEVRAVYQDKLKRLTFLVAVKCSNAQFFEVLAVNCWQD